MESVEIFRDVKGFEGYKISNVGRVVSFKRYPKGKGISPYTDKDGYVCVHIRTGNKSKGQKVHRLVAQAFIDNPENLPQVNHKDGNKKNNSVENLEWVTNTQNQRHAWANDLKTVRLTVENVKDIKYMIKKGFRNVDISKKYNIDPSLISGIRTGKIWTFVQGGCDE